MSYEQKSIWNIYIYTLYIYSIKHNKTNTHASISQVKKQKTKKFPVCPTDHSLFFASSNPPNYLGFYANHSHLFLEFLPFLYDF